ncbi:MAG TPA: hypothetical protein VFS83_09545 [Ktedonobacterales bacterium]|nr:hypothetical protein [Ktedonobacterales bacterium]
MDDERQSPYNEPPKTSSGEGEARDARDADEGTAMTPDMEAELPESGAVPPGYDWPTHGGYLGCLLGMMPACLVGGFLGSTFVAFLNKAGVVPPVVAGFLVAALFVACIVGFGRIGWVLGRRFYRKYPRPAPTWGEDDSVAGAVESANAVHKSTEGSHTTDNTTSEQTTRQAMQ